jgi:ribosomal protein L37AE/L43A
MATSLSVSSGVWRCRVCGYERYYRVAVLRKNGTRYETQFFACSQCSVMFLNPNQFNAYSTANPNIEFPPIVTPLRKRSSKQSNGPSSIRASSRSPE